MKKGEYESEHVMPSFDTLQFSVLRTYFSPFCGFNTQSEAEGAGFLSIGYARLYFYKNQYLD